MKRLGHLKDLNAKKGKGKSKRQPIVLKGQDESGLQSSMSSNLTVLNAIDTHEGRGNRVEFIKPRSFPGDKTVYANSGKADLTSNKRRMVFEVMQVEDL